MPITLKTQEMKYKDPSSGEYIGFNSVAETTTQQQISAISSVATQKLNAINTAGTSNLNSLNTRAAEVEASLPTSGEMEDMIAVTFDYTSYYPEGKYVIYPETTGGVTTNKLYRLTAPHEQNVAWGNTSKSEIKLGDDVQTLKSAIKNKCDDNTNVTAEYNLVWLRNGSSSANSIDITFHDNKVLLDGTSSAATSVQISDDYILPAGDYVLTDGKTTHNTSFSINAFSVTGSTNVATTNDADAEGKTYFTLSQETKIRLYCYVWSGKTFDDFELTVSIAKLGIKSNKTLTQDIDDIHNLPNVAAGNNIIPLTTGTQTQGGLTIAVGENDVTINGSDASNRSFFITSAKSLPAGNYTIFEGKQTANDLVKILVFNTSTSASIADSLVSPRFTLESTTSVRLILYVTTGGSYSNYKMIPALVSLANLSNEQLSEAVGGFAGLDENASLRIAKTAYYPFIRDDKGLTDNNKLFRNAIKSVLLFGGDKDELYYFSQSYINSSALNPKGTYLSIRNSSKELCAYYKLTVPTAHQFLFFSEVNNSGICAIVEVDFTNIPDNYFANPYLLANVGYFTLASECIYNPESYVELNVPEKIHAVVGKESNIYWESAVKALNLDNYVVEVVGAGMNLGNRWSYVPQSAETTSVTIRVRDENYRVLAEKTIPVITKALAVSSAQTLKAIHIGDSMIDNEYHLAHLESDFTGSNITYTIEGTRPHSEGRGGWTSSEYILFASSGGVTNAFYNPAENVKKFDFSYYMENNPNIADPDIVFIFLGTNDIKGQTQFGTIQDAVRGTIGNIQFMIDSIHAYKSSIKVVVETPAIGAHDQWPYAMMYGNNSIKQSLHKYGIQNQVAMMYKAFDGRESENIYIIPTGTSLDNENGFPTRQISAAARLSAQLTVQADCYHPSSEGYYQFADCEFAFIRSLFN